MDRRQALALMAAAATSACAGTGDDIGTAPRIRWLARKEGELHLLTNTNLMQPLLNDFQDLFPEIRVQMRDVNSSHMARIVTENADAGVADPDFVWSSAMDVQVKLINDGYAQPYRTPHRHAMPDGSVWRDQGFGVTAEPVVFAYNRRLLTPDLRPGGHAHLLDLLKARPEAFHERITLYDAEHSGVALMQLSADTQIYPDAWRLMAALGATRPRLDTSGQRMMLGLAEGRSLFIYNMNQSYGLSWSAIHPDIGLIMPDDYHLAVSRVGFIARNAAHPNASRLFLDYVLSRRGQGRIAALGIRPVRIDLTPGVSAEVEGARPIRVGPALLANLDQERRAALLSRWSEAMGDAPRASLDPNVP